jgi:hypothetical protein
MGRAQSAAAFFPQLRLCPSGGYASDGILARWQSEKSQLPKTEVVLDISLVLYGSGLFFAVTQHKQFATISIRSCCPWRWWAQVAAKKDKAKEKSVLDISDIVTYLLHL